MCKNCVDVFTDPHMHYSFRYHREDGALFSPIRIDHLVQTPRKVSSFRVHLLVMQPTEWVVDSWSDSQPRSHLLHKSCNQSHLGWEGLVIRLWISGLCVNLTMIFGCNSTQKSKFDMYLSLGVTVEYKFATTGRILKYITQGFFWFIFNRQLYIVSYGLLYT